ncbi:MAG: hypothetical protein COT39_02610 [Parcubacteria group bacterium CG08_land_8_20_14_0_20_48_21]|nr:MAG: hypothetical protein COT39_02610 [Parcubacteria group bacterium CG08_land_8_20_14_0_20_48_21]PJC40182.1 MAG: hypothetical protein CO043_00280 [Parcubacteria group bacterium CG_4_9_14_0_2_um_filter_48_40]
MKKSLRIVTVLSSILAVPGIGLYFFFMQREQGAADIPRPPRANADIPNAVDSAYKEESNDPFTRLLYYTFEKQKKAANNSSLQFADAYPAETIAFLQHTLQEKELLLNALGRVLIQQDYTDEYHRIERDTRDRKSWEEQKALMRNDPQLINTYLLKPLLLDQKLKQLYEQDAAYQQEKKQEAEQLRERLARDPDNFQTIAGDAFAVQTLRRNPRPEDIGFPEAQNIDPATQSFLDEFQRIYLTNLQHIEALLQEQGFVSSVQDENGNWSIYQLVSSNDTELTVNTAIIAKPDYAVWLADQKMLFGLAEGK